MRSRYVDQVKLLLNVLPVLKNQDIFALKGGTAINFFVENMPRLSVDIDLTYTGIEPRDISLKKFAEGLNKIKEDIKSLNKNFIIKDQYTQDKKFIKKIFVHFQNTFIKVEPNYIMRGTLFPIEKSIIADKITKILVCLLMIYLC